MRSSELVMAHPCRREPSSTASRSSCRRQHCPPGFILFPRETCSPCTVISNPPSNTLHGRHRRCSGSALRWGSPAACTRHTRTAAARTCSRRPRIRPVGTGTPQRAVLCRRGPRCSPGRAHTSGARPTPWSSPAACVRWGSKPDGIGSRTRPSQQCGR